MHTHAHLTNLYRYTKPNLQSRALTDSHYLYASWGEPGRGGLESLYISVCEFLRIAKPCFLKMVAAGRLTGETKIIRWIASVDTSSYKHRQAHLSIIMRLSVSKLIINNYIQIEFYI